MKDNDNLTIERPTFVTHLECAMEGDHYPADQIHNLSKAGKPLLVRYDLAGVKKALTKEALAQRPADMWRYREMLPVRKVTDIVSLGEVMTPLIRLPKLGKKLGGGEIIVKDEGRLPTGSFKARGLVMAVSMGKALGIKHMAMPTNGNAGAALAAYATSCGIRTTIFCPADTPEVNVSEIELQGATVYRVNGLIDDCGKIVGEGKAKAGWFDTSTLKEPYRIEGKKTMGLELAEQLGWEMPDVIFYPTGGGTGLIGMWKAFAELEAIGFIGSKRPRMVAVQASGCAPMVRAFEAGTEHAPRWEDAHTIASGIRVPQAVGDFLILRAVRQSKGFAIAVPDEKISAALNEVAREEGLLLCPEGAATYAAYKESLADGRVTKNDRVMLFNCATGLKYPLAAGHAHARSPSADRLREVIVSRGLMEHVMRRMFLAVVAVLAFGSAAIAQNFPSHPITIIVPFSAGGPSDAMARILAERMKVTLGEALLIENVTGAGGSIGVGRAVRSPPDGYTISFGHLGTHVANGAIYKLGYDLVADLEPVVLLPSNPMIIVSKNAVPAKSLKEFLAWLKALPKPPTAGTAGAGSGSHIAGLYFENITGIKLQYVPYRGTAPAMNDLVAGQIDLIVDQTSNSISQVRAGTIRAYAITADKRIESASDIPTVDEAGLPGFHMTLWSGLWVPKDTPKEIVARLNAAAVDALNDPAVRKQLENLGLQMPPKDQLTPAALGDWQKAEITKWWPMIKAANVKVD